MSDDARPITSSSNPLAKRIRALRRRKAREAEGAFFVDGIQGVWQALDHTAPIETLVVAPDLLTSDAATERLARAEGAGVPVARVSPRLYESLSEREHPSGVGAIVTAERASLEDYEPAPDALMVAVEDISNPGNLGTIVRTADGVGASAVVVVGESTDPHDPAAVKASMGTIFSVPVLRARGIDELFEWARVRQLSVVTTSARAEHDYAEADYVLPLVLLLGSEGEGLAPETIARGALQVRIDMAGAASSLNVAVAAGILLYEIRRRGAARPGPA